MLIADTNEFHPLTDGPAYAAGRAPDGTPYTVIILRATYSTWHVDNAYPASTVQARAGRLLVGHYGYMAKTDDPATFGRFLAQTIAANGGLRLGDTVWVDDEETVGGNETPRIAAALTAVHTILRDPVQDEGEYTGDAFYHAHVGARVQANGVATHLWVASYGTGAPADGEDLFQFTDAQTVPGVSGPCDCSVFNGTVDQWRTLFAGTPAPAPPPLPAPINIPEDNMIVQGIKVQIKGGEGWCAKPATVKQVMSVVPDEIAPADAHRYVPVPAFAGAATDSTGQSVLVFGPGPFGPAADGTYGFTVWGV